jgi:hypothetical protein
MKQPFSISQQNAVKLVLFLVIITCCIQAAGAKVNVYHVVITPNTEIIGNQTPVEVIALMDITSEDHYTFSPDNTLQFWTDLQDPVWTPLLSRDGNLLDLPVRHSRSMTLTSWDLSYPSGSSLSLKVTLKGIAPNVTSTQDKTMFRVAEATSHSTIKETEVIHTRQVTYVPGAQPPQEPYVPRGSVRVTSDPDHAAISLDGMNIGQTPHTLEGTPAGLHTLTLSLPGYHDAVMTVTVIERQTVDIATTLHPAPGTPGGEQGFVTIISEPPGAGITIGGISSGTTPLYNRETEAGIHPVEVTLPGYQPFVSEIQVIPGQGNTVLVQLNPVQGSGAVVQSATPEPASCWIRFSSDPPGADVYLDNRFIGITPVQIGDLEPGLHETSIVLPFYQVYRENVSLEPGEVMDVATRFTLGDIAVPGIDVILGLFSGLKLPALPAGGEPGGAPGDDRQKAYEELVRALEEEGGG